MKLTQIFPLIFLFCIVNSFAQLSKKHYIPPLTSSDGFTDQYIYISTPKASNVSYTITPVGNPALAAYRGVVTNGTPVIQDVLNVNGSNSDFDNDSQLHIPSFNISGVINDRGFIIEADDEIFVSIRVRSAFANQGNRFHAGALVSKGAAALGNDFRIGGFIRQAVGNTDLTYASIMATEDDTNITISDLPAGTTIIGYSGNFPINITLNEGESYIVASGVGQASNVIGGRIQSDKPIVVNSGSATGSFGDNQGNADYGFDQIVGADKIGDKYITVRGDGDDVVENVLVIAHENNTDIAVNGVTITNTPLNAGEFVVIEGDRYNNAGNMYIETTKPAFVYQGIGSLGGNGNPSQANQGLFFVPPLSCENKGDVNEIADIDRIGNENFPGGITIVTNASATININGQNIGALNNVQGPFNVTGTADYVTYKVTGLTGNVNVTSDQELYCAYFNRNRAATTGAFYSGFPSAPEIGFDNAVSSLGSCIPNVTLQASNAALFDSVRWEFFDISTNSWVIKSTSDTYKPTEAEAGKFRLIGEFTCAATKPFISQEIPVSICPDDFDNDLIIDNVDVDLDNDGISNCDESLGNVTVNIADINNPSLLFQDGTTNNAIVSSSFTATSAGTFSGEATGNFTSELDASPSSENTLELNFTRNVNVRFTQNNSNLVNQNITYSISIEPGDKNITLIDPDNQLLVDPDFNGSFETSNINISSSEIRFKINDSPTGNTPFQFVANQVTKISFTHSGTLLNAADTFSGNIQLTCFARDTDGDGIEDALDIDSDNDGIPDFYESVALANVVLTGTDTNQDGLDEIFDTVTPNQDTDGDGIPNFIDLDSDNDGIYDLVESGYAVADADNDGIIDNATPANVGANGLLDGLETNPDSGTITTGVRNSDESAVITANRDNLFDFVDLDSDADDCFDVTEAGFTGDASGILFANPFAVNANGLVINNTDGYTTPNANYLTEAPIIVNNFPNPVFCENDTDTMSIDSNADGFQWQLSTDSGASWNNLNNDAVYSGVNTSDLQITNTPVSFNNYQFRVLLSRTGNTCTDDPSNAVTLTVNPLPVIKNNTVDLLLCIDASDNNPTVNLTTAEINISETTGVSFEYFEDLNATTQITNFTSYPIPVNQITTVYARVTSDQGCSEGLVTLNINASQVADNTYNDTQPPVCDDLLDANGNDTPGMNDDTDGISNFSLDRNAIVNGINPPANTEVFFYENSSDRNNSLNEIDITNYRNDINKIDITNIPEGIRFPIYYKIVSTINNDCQGLGEFFLEVHAVPEANTVSDIEDCDDNASGSTTDGRNANINLRDPQRIATILGNQNPNDYTISFHKTQAGATDGVSDIITNDTNYTNDAPAGFTPGTTSEQTIFVRVETNGGSMCYNANTSFKIIVQPIPDVPANVSDLIACDVATPSDADSRNRVAQNIDLTEREAEILNGRTNLTVEYYTSQQDAENRTNVIPTPSNYQNSTDSNITSFPADFNGDDPAIQTIFYTIVDQTGLQCSSVVSTFRLLIYPEPFVNPISVLSDCDNDDDGDDTNGIIQNIDLNGKIPEILGANRNPNDYNVSFYLSRNQADIGSNADALPSPYTNTNRNETIFVRVENKASSCVNTENSFELIINSLPDFTVTTPQILCLNDLPLNISVENPGDVYQYEWKDVSGNTISNQDNYNVTSAGTYTVIATDRVTFCQREENIVVNASNVATLDASFVTIIDEANNLSSENNLSISIDTVNNDLGPGDYQFAIVNTDTNTRTPFIGFQDEPLFENLEGGVYQIIVNDKNGCTPDATLLVSVIQFPKFFTPNGDSENDTWVIKGANKTFYPNASINIFNRFGKLVAQLQVDGPGWDGTYNGTQLPSDDYWYNITLIPSDTTKPTINKRGNFSLLRR